SFDSVRMEQIPQTRHATAIPSVRRCRSYPRFSTDALSDFSPFRSTRHRAGIVQGDLLRRATTKVRRRYVPAMAIPIESPEGLHRLQLRPRLGPSSTDSLRRIPGRIQLEAVFPAAASSNSMAIA